MVCRVKWDLFIDLVLTGLIQRVGKFFSFLHHPLNKSHGTHAYMTIHLYIYVWMTTYTCAHTVTSNNDVNSSSNYIDGWGWEPWRPIEWPIHQTEDSCLTFGPIVALPGQMWPEGDQNHNWLVWDKFHHRQEQSGKWKRASVKWLSCRLQDVKYQTHWEMFMNTVVPPLSYGYQQCLLLFPFTFPHFAKLQPFNSKFLFKLSTVLHSKWTWFGKAHICLHTVHKDPQLTVHSREKAKT